MSAALASTDMEHGFSYLDADSLSLAVRAEGRKGRLPAMRAMKLFHFLLPLEAAARPGQSLGLKYRGLQTAYRCFSRSVNTLSATVRGGSYRDPASRGQPPARSAPNRIPWPCPPPRHPRASLLPHSWQRRPERRYRPARSRTESQARSSVLPLRSTRSEFPHGWHGALRLPRWS